MRKKSRISNFVMIALVLIIIVCGVMITGKTKGWFTDEQSAQIHCIKLSGIANVQRNGISYRAKENLALREGDLVETGHHASLQLALKEAGDISMGGATVLKINEEKSGFLAEKGIFFADVQDSEGISLSFDGGRLTLQDVVVSVSVHEGSSMISVLEGSVELTPDGRSAEKIKKGEQCSLIWQNENGLQINKNKLKIASLDDFSIRQALDSSRVAYLCFSEEDLIEVQTARIKEVAQSRAAAVENGQTKAPEAYVSTKNLPESTEEFGRLEYVDEQTEKATGETDTKNTALTDGGRSGSSSSPGSSPGKSIAVGNETANISVVANKNTEQTDSGDLGDPSGKNTSAGDETVSTPVETKKNYCTIEIRCETILNHMEDLSPGKNAYVPANGLILASSTIEFSEGETVFDVLKRACSLTGIQLEYEYTPLYGSYYIEGINNLYEFDAGSESGWIYKINGWAANYGCSSCYLKDGDVITWVYTCVGYGSDV